MKNYAFILILLSIALGITCGIFFPNQMKAISWIGELFINLLKLIALPLIFCALISAITSIGGFKQLGSIGAYTMIYILLSVSIAVVIGLVLLNLFQPGVGVSADLILANTPPSHIKTLPFSSFVLSLFPPSIVEAAAKYEIMPIVFFSIVFAIACISVGKPAEIVSELFTGLREVLVKMIVWLMYLTPIGLFSLLGAAIAKASLQHLLLQSLKGIFIFVVIFLFGLFLQIFWQAVLVMLLTKNFKQFALKAGNALLTAFATSSSMATLPVAMLVAKEQNVSNDVARFVIPLASTINLSSTAMYEAVSALFFCQVLGYDLSITTQIGVFFTAIIAGMGATGIPEAGLITMVMVLRTVNVPIAAIALLLPFDRILDRFRTLTNVWGDLVCATVVDHFYKKKHVARSHMKT